MVQELDYRIPYIYLIGWSKLDKWYYGRRTAKNCSPADLWVKYFTSSKHVKKFRKEYGEPDIIQIRKIFINVQDCINWETKFLLKIDAAKKEKWLNKTNGDLNFDTTGVSSPMKGVKRPDISERNKKGQPKEVRLKISESRKGKPPSNKGSKGLQTAWNKGLTSEICVKILSGNNHPTKRKEVREKIAKSNSNKIFTEKRKENISNALHKLEPLICPHCNLISKSRSNMKRYHFNNCKKALK